MLAKLVWKSVIYNYNVGKTTCHLIVCVYLKLSKTDECIYRMLREFFQSGDARVIVGKSKDW